MPELPEIERAARLLAAAANGKQVAALRPLHPAVERGLPPGDAMRAVGRRVDAVERRGKYQLLHLSGGLVLVAHFRMAGDWQPGDPGAAPRFARAVLEFTDGTAVYLVDSRAFATLTVRPAGGEGLPELGPDAGSQDLDGAALARALSRRRGPLKPALLDQAVIAGLGNIYAAEALWHAELSPFLPANALSAADSERLAAAIRHTIALAREDPGRYSRGEALTRLSAYGREGEPCSRCGTPIERVVQAGRSTYYCPGCQQPSAGGERTISRAPRAARL